MTVVDDILAHHGVKGMKWGVRNDKGHEGEQVKTKNLKKLDKRWEQQNTGIRGYIKVHNAVADRMNNGEIDRFNNEPRWKKAADDGVLLDNNHPETKAYMKAYETLSNKMFAEEAVKLGTNPSGSKAYELREDAEGNPYAYLAPVKKDVKHAAGDIEPVLKINRDKNGLITGVSSVEVELKHHGVKGMKWGVRKERTAVDVSVHAPAGRKVKTAGGNHHPASEDAIKAATTRQKAKASTTDALSNQELQDLVKRMQLEQQFADLNQKRQTGAKKFVSKLLGQVGAQQAQRVGNQVAAERIDAALKKKRTT